MREREATGLEQAMRQTEAEHFDLAALLRLQTASLRSLYPDTEIELDGANQTVTLLGAPDLVGQALDKLVGNAMDFRRPGTAVRIGCRLDDHSVHLAVDNDGPPLPTDVDVFQSMTSGRQGRQQEPHLGLGLFIVRLIAEFHGGQATARNLPGGVSVEISLPR